MFHVTFEGKTMQHKDNNDFDYHFQAIRFSKYSSYRIYLAYGFAGLSRIIPAYNIDSLDAAFEACKAFYDSHIPFLTQLYLLSKEYKRLRLSGTLSDVSQFKNACLHRYPDVSNNVVMIICEDLQIVLKKRNKKQRRQRL